LRNFFYFNKQASLWLERQLGFFPPPIDLGEDYKPTGKVADIGGGKKPFFQEKPNGLYYVGMDIDPTELSLAPEGLYDATVVLDITKDNEFRDFDAIICRYTLEHVDNTEAAIRVLLSMLKEGGTCYISAPTRFALFSKVNLILPEAFKRWLLAKLYPAKETDGFRAYYDRCSPTEMTELIKLHGGEVIALNRVYFSGYLTFFLPLHLIWRVTSFVQMALNNDYCERYELILVKTDSTNVP